jgi:uncharacterized membrane protein
MSAVWTHNVNTAMLGRETATGGRPGVLEGQYQVRGSNIANGDEYTGTMNISRHGETYYIKWDAVGSVYYGIGIRHGDSFVVGWTLGEGKQFGVVEYSFDGDIARGRWTMWNQSTLSHEHLQRVQP